MNIICVVCQERRPSNPSRRTCKPCRTSIREFQALPEAVLVERAVRFGITCRRILAARFGVGRLTG